MDKRGKSGDGKAMSKVEEKEAVDLERGPEGEDSRVWTKEERADLVEFGGVLKSFRQTDNVKFRKGPLKDFLSYHWKWLLKVDLSAPFLTSLKVNKDIGFETASDCSHFYGSFVSKEKINFAQILTDILVYLPSANLFTSVKILLSTVCKDHSEHSH